ncbi:Os11g0707450 [Oryza sativa Japonica Group]|uniref:Os11g0707450 protein n=1 Tax=Oryza sativa subsp. japonica TaxID=39947 RepID=A0A0P0Y5V0_ORYSJ|nr:hypothetical protein EE612_057229 [Oryza sativa]BAT15422.1 Os11g0707450 [Oryza sativa Japonica Group]
MTTEQRRLRTCGQLGWRSGGGGGRCPCSTWRRRRQTSSCGSSPTRTRTPSRSRRRAVALRCGGSSRPAGWHWGSARDLELGAELVAPKRRRSIGGST